MNADAFGLPQNLGDGLLLRWGRPKDAEELAEFNKNIHSDNPDEPEEWLVEWTRQLMDGTHPTTKAGDFTIVVDQNAGNKIVSSLVHISQRWSYDGIPFGVGRPELVGTDPDYRRRGLVRKQMDAVHALSASRGELIQAITGIPWYYRLFGYEMTVNLGGGREFFWSRRGNDKTVEKEAYSLHAAALADIPLLEQLYPFHYQDSLLVRLRDRKEWEYEIEGANRTTMGARDFHLIEHEDAGVIGYVEYRQWGTGYVIRELGIRPGHSWRAAALFLTRALKQKADAANEEREKPITNISFFLPENHPSFKALNPHLERYRRPYAWYIRVPDLPGFIHHITPVLEQRLADSVMAGHSGDLRLNFYTDQLRMVFEDGRLTEIGGFEPKQVEDADALFPGLTFLQLLFGHRSFSELDANFPDCYAPNAEAGVLLDCLFPRRLSDVSPLS